MQIQLTRSEQQRVDRYERLLEYRRAGQPVWDHDLAEAKQLADQARMNADARARYQATRAAERQAQAEHHAAAVAERQQAEIDAHKQHARAAFPGTDADFDAAWPEILKTWQTARALAAMRGVEDEAQRRVRSML